MILCVGGFNVPANVAVEQQGVIYPVRIFAIAAYGYVDIKANIGIDDAEGNGVRGSVFVSDDLLDVEVVNALAFRDCRRILYDVASL